MQSVFDTILTNKWGILLISEILAWLFVGLMIYFRYFFQSKALFWVSTTISLFFGYVPHLSIPLLMALKEKSVLVLLENKGDFLFILLIVLLVAFGLTFGKKYLVKFDAYMFNLAEKRRSA